MATPKGVSGNPLGQSKHKPLTNALLYLGTQAITGKGGKIGLPKKPTPFQRAARAILQQAGKGDVAAFKEIADRVEGKVPVAVIGGPEDAPAINIKSQEMTLKEAARRIGYMLLRAQKDLEREEAAKATKP